MELKLLEPAARVENGAVMIVDTDKDVGK